MPPAGIPGIVRATETDATRAAAIDGDPYTESDFDDPLFRVIDESAPALLAVVPDRGSIAGGEQVLLLGDGLMLVAFSAVVLVHFQMGDDWRSGTRDGDHTQLITTGLFAYSRNPMMLGVLLAQLGFFLALPSAFTLVCLIVGVSAVVAQVRVEERLLSDRFGEFYEAYKARTPRWLLR